MSKGISMPATHERLSRQSLKRIQLAQDEALEARRDSKDELAYYDEIRRISSNDWLALKAMAKHALYLLTFGPLRQQRHR